MGKSRIQDTGFGVQEVKEQISEGKERGQF
jgi:hypothetical protein